MYCKSRHVVVVVQVSDAWSGDVVVTIRWLCVVINLWNSLGFVHPPRSLALLKIEGVSLYTPCLFGKGIVVHARQTCRQQTSHLLKQTLSETITPIDNSCMLLFNPAINPVVGWYYFLMLMLIIVWDYYLWNRMHIVSFRQGMPLRRYSVICAGLAVRACYCPAYVVECTSMINANSPYAQYLRKWHTPAQNQSKVSSASFDAVKWHKILLNNLLKG